ncbi:beta-lactamase-like protein [Zopfochytrium polystomum]|nr:beta-lactamase-like protein [Zopfochytrium polystomum]
MTSFVRFVPLSGAMDEGPLCYLLQIDEARILLDCGWSDSFDANALRFLAGVAKHVDAVLLTHADLHHLGAFPYAVTNLGLSCVAYATDPVRDLAPLCLHDALQSKRAAEDFTLFSAADVDAAFDRVIPLKASQPMQLPGSRCKGISVTAYPAGHSLGGAIWKIKKDTDEIIYAVDYNHAGERHLQRSSLGLLTRPTLLITDAFNTLNVHKDKRGGTHIILQTAANQGSVLIPIESTTRSMELAYLLEGYWAANPDITKLPLFLLTRQSKRTITVAKRMLEWMAESITSLLAQDRKVPFDFSHVRLVHRLADVESVNGPKVILASLPSMDVGLSRSLFLSMCRNRNNTVLLCDRGPPNSLARHLYNIVKEQQGPVFATFDISEKRRVPLEGEELDAYTQAEERRKREQEEAAQAAAAAAEDNDSDLSDEEGVARAAGVSSGRQIGGDAGGNTGSFDFYVKDSQRTSGFFKQSRIFKMYPITDFRRKMDDYGELIDPAAFVHSDARLAAAQAEQSEEETNIEDEEEKIPSKYIKMDMNLEVRCRLHFIDFEGRADGRAIRILLPHISPRKLILVHGSEEATTKLRDFCLENDAMTNEVFCPVPNEWVNVSAATEMHQVRIPSLKQSSEYELAYVSGASAAVTAVPVLDVLPVEHRRAHQPIIVGDVRLSEFRRVLAEAGFEAEFTAGVLVVNGNVMARRAAAAGGGGGARLILEGGLSADYYKVRKLLYNEHAVLM